jgi:hypothetical protein
MGHEQMGSGMYSMQVVQETYIKTVVQQTIT